MNLEEVKEHIKEEEGYRDTIYKDTLNFATIGYGHLVLPRDKFKEGIKYSHKELEKVFEYDFAIAKQDMESLTKDLDIVDGAKEILIHMLFQLGKPKVMKFKKMFEALKNKRYDMAKLEMLDSLWAKKHTPARAERLANKMGKLT
jgi:GH24 family phage-related lysozyme (muramidase)